MSADEESDDASWSFKAQLVPEVRREQHSLDEFRQKWQMELTSPTEYRKEDESRVNIQPVHVSDLESIGSDITEPPDGGISESDEERAKLLFLKGAEQEKLGRVYDALSYYRRAVQIVPDIEYKIYEAFKSQQPIGTDADDPIVESIENQSVNDDSLECLDGVDLIGRFGQQIERNGGRLFDRATDPSVITTQTVHIGDLPMELILYILKWVVSSELDIQSLEQCARVSKGFYLCARDPEIWRLACLRIWGQNTKSTSLYDSWRMMFLDRTKVLFNGCYISKTSYIRFGENTFQDQRYRPIHLIEYYRYLRFFPDGSCLMMTSTDEPQYGVRCLQTRQPSKKEVLKGYFRLHDDIGLVIVVVTRSTVTSNIIHHVKHEKLSPNKQTFYIELTIDSHKCKKFCRLNWKQYSIIQMRNNQETTTNFDIQKSKYPPLWFSRVKSYNLEATKPL